MSVSDTTSMELSYAIPNRVRRYGWLYFFSRALLVLLIAPFVKIGGMRVIGFEYSVFINNVATICPDRVTSQSGTRIDLADGRSFKHEAYVDALASDLAQAENMVFVDSNEQVVYGRFCRTYCGFSRPERSQLITIPLVRRILPSHGSVIIAGLDTRK